MQAGNWARVGAVLGMNPSAGNGGIRAALRRFVRCAGETGLGLDFMDGTSPDGPRQILVREALVL